MCGHLVTFTGNKVALSYQGHCFPINLNTYQTKEAHFYYEQLPGKCKTKIELYSF